MSAVGPAVAASISKRLGVPTMSKSDTEWDLLMKRFEGEDAAANAHATKNLRKWAWRNAYYPGDTRQENESQALRLIRFVETGSFDAGT